MKRIFLETNKNTTPEYVFVKTLMERYSSEDFEIVVVGGKDNLRNAVNEFKKSTINGDRNLLLFDADSELNGGGFESRSRELFELRRSLGIEFDIFLFPNNKDDGDFELLLENIARQDIHGERFFRCFSNYEECLSSHIGMDGQPMYLCPNRKAKVYSYITSMKLSNAERKMIGKGYWLFDNEAYWNLDSEYIVPLKEFLLKHKD